MGSKWREEGVVQEEEVNMKLFRRSGPMTRSGSRFSRGSPYCRFISPHYRPQSIFVSRSSLVFLYRFGTFPPSWLSLPPRVSLDWSRSLVPVILTDSGPGQNKRKASEESPSPDSQQQIKKARTDSPEKEAQVRFDAQLDRIK